MTNLKSVNVGFNKYCGPAVLSILTGKSTDECASVISKINGSYNVAGVLLNDLLRAADKLGFDQKYCEPQGSLFRTLTAYISKDGMYIVTVPKHFVCIEIKDKKIYFCDNHTKEPIPAASSARLMQNVEAIYQVIERPKPSEEQIKKELDDALWKFQMAIECAALEVTEIAKTMKIYNIDQIPQAKYQIISEFRKRVIY